MAKGFSESPSSFDCARISTQLIFSSVSSSTFAFGGAAQASSEQLSGKLPRKKAVLTTTPRMRPAKPRRIKHQSKPCVRRRRDSQPSIHLPRSVYLPSMKIGAGCFNRFSFGAKKSSLANKTAAPKRSEQRSIKSVKSISRQQVG